MSSAKSKSKLSQPDADDDPHDKDFSPPKRPTRRSVKPDIEDIPLDQFGNEIVEDPPEVYFYCLSDYDTDNYTLQQQPKHPKCKASFIITSDNDDLDPEDDLSLPKSKGKGKQTAKQSKSTQNTNEPSSGDESDGKTALRAVEEEEARGGTKKGPSSST